MNGTDGRAGNEAFSPEPGLEEREAALSTLQALSRPRLVGTEGARRVEAELSRRFRALGYEIQELPFGFSSWPGRFGVSLAGGVLAVALVATLAAFRADAPQAALGYLGGGTLLLLFIATSARSAIRWLPWGRISTANWMVSWPGANPRYLIMAHRDSKSQNCSLFLRAAAAVAAPVSVAGLAALAVAGSLGVRWATFPLAAIVALPGLGAAVVLIFCFAGNRSPGALDNASGLAALLALARRERGRDDVAFVVTDAEELGLAGALAACSVLPRVRGIINLDGLDDEGSFHIIERHGYPPRGYAPDLAAALLGAAQALGFDAARRRLPPGILLDHVALVDAGIPAVTLMRGSLQSLRRVHRSADVPTGMSGAGVVSAALLVSGALRRLRASAHASR